MRATVDYITRASWKLTIGELRFETTSEVVPGDDKWSAPIKISDLTDDNGNSLTGTVFWDELKEYSKKMNENRPHGLGQTDACEWDSPSAIDVDFFRLRGKKRGMYIESEEDIADFFAIFNK